MILPPPPAYDTPSKHLSLPSSSDFPALPAPTLSSARRTGDDISYASRVSGIQSTEEPSMSPIGTERFSPERMKQKKLGSCPVNIVERTKEESRSINRLAYGVDEKMLDGTPCGEDDPEATQVKYLYRQLELFNSRRHSTQNPTSQFDPAIQRQANYTEDIARYLKLQADDVALRHAQDLAAGRVQPSGEGGFHPPPGPSDSCNTTVFVGGLHHNVTEPELFKFFQPFGQISYVKIPPGKGCGFVQYVEKRCAELALARMQGFMLNGCKIRLSWGKTGTDKVSKAQDAQTRAITVLQGLGYMAPEYLEKLSFAMDLVDNEPLFRNIMTIHRMIMQQEGESQGQSDVSAPLKSSARQSSGASSKVRSEQQARLKDDTLFGFSPFSTSFSPPSHAKNLSGFNPDNIDLCGDDTDHSPTRPSTGPTTPGFPSSFSPLQAPDNILDLCASNPHSQPATSPGSSGSHKFEKAPGMSPSSTHAIDDTRLFEAFAASPGRVDYTRPFGSRSSLGSLQLNPENECTRDRALSDTDPLASEISHKLNSFNIGRYGSHTSSPRPFASPFPPLSAISGALDYRK